MENNQFVYRYSAQNNREVERIRERYLPRTESPMERLKRLDRTVQNAGRVPAITVGVIGALIFGVGLCFGLDVLAGAPFLPYLLGVAGLCLMIPVYPVYRACAKRRRERLAPEILRLSDEILNATTREN